MKPGQRHTRPPEFPTFADNPIERHRARINIDIEFEATGVECYSVRLLSPSSGDIFSDGKYYDNRANRSFFARVYKRVHRPHSHVVVMYNGLDETIYTTTGQLFEFYDELGLRLASAGKLAILLPTPYHMNRALAYSDSQAAHQLKGRLGDSFVRMHIPSEALTREPSKIYANHLQGCMETLDLCRFLLGNRMKYFYPDLEYRGIVPERIATTLRTWVTRSPYISLLGYSLGGLRAITEFLFDRIRARRDGRAPLFSGCVAVCSGGSLSDLAPPFWIDQMKWKKMIDNLVAGDADNLLNSARRYFPDEGGFSSDYFQTLKDIFLGSAFSMRLLEDDAAKAGRSMLFLLGGSDTLVPPESIRRINPEGGVNILQVSGLGHLFAYDLAWSTTKGLICDVIAQFLDNVPTMELLPDPERLIQLLVLLDLSLHIMPYKSSIDADTLRSAAQGQAGRQYGGDLLERILGTTLAHSLKDAFETSHESVDDLFEVFIVELFEEIALQVKRRVVNPALFWPEWERHFLDGVLHRDPPLRTAVLKVVDYGRQPRLDYRLVETELLTRKRRDELFNQQEARLEPIRKSLYEVFTRYLVGQVDSRNRPEPEDTFAAS